MGSCVSKCCRKSEKKYKEEKVIPTNPEQDETDVKIVVNSGATIVKCRETDKPAENKPAETATNDEMKDEKSVDDDKKYGVRRAKKTSDKKKRLRKSRDSDEDTESSSSSDTSDSDSDGKCTKQTRQVYNKGGGGGTTIISKRTIIGGNKYSYGKNCENMTINYGSSKSSHKRKTNKRKQTDKRKQTEPPKPVFKSYYSESGATEEEERQYTSLQNKDPPMGNFIDTRNLHAREYVFESSVRIDVSEWVCKICFPNGSGTGFRVGERYIMTANHVVKQILDGGYQQVGSSAQDPYARLQDATVYAVFDYVTDAEISDRQKFFFESVVHFQDDETDTAVLELKDNQRGTPMPLSFTNFSSNIMNSKFSLIGHSEGKRKEINYVDSILDMTSTATQTYIVNVRHQCQQHANRDYEFPPHNILTNPHRYLFHCKFTNGASGSPGVVVLEDGRVVVVTMLLGGFPDWYYDPTIAEERKAAWPKDYCMEQGVNLNSVYERMANQYSSLCCEIFYSHKDILPDPSI